MQQLQYDNSEILLCAGSIKSGDEREELRADRVSDMLSQRSAGVRLLQPRGAVGRRNDKSDDDTDECEGSKTQRGSPL